MAKKLTHEDYEQWLAENMPHIEAQAEYIDDGVKIGHRCSAGHDLLVTPGNIKSAHRRGSIGCQACTKAESAEKYKLSTEEYQRQLDADGRGFTVTGEYKNAHTKMLHHCPLGHSWMARPNAVKNNNRGGGCPTCSENQRAELRQVRAQDYISWLERNRPSIKALDEYAGSMTKISHQCGVCDHTWSSPPNSIKNGRGCPSCGRRNSGISHRKTQEEYEQWLRENAPEYEVLGAYSLSHAPITHRHVCGYEWPTRPDSIRDGKGCPRCADRASDNDAVYCWEWIENGVGTGIYKVGVTSYRLSDERIRNCCSRNGIDYRLIALCQTSEDDAKAFESVLLNMGDIVALPDHIKDGRTEFRIYNDEELGFIYELLGVKEAQAEAA